MIEGSFCYWLIYGNILYYSKECDCSGSGTIYYVMSVALFFGYIHLILYAVIIIIFVMIKVLKFNNTLKKKRRLPLILKGLNKFKFSR